MNSIKKIKAHKPWNSKNKQTKDKSIKNKELAQEEQENYSSESQKEHEKETDIKQDNIKEYNEGDKLQEEKSISKSILEVKPDPKNTESLLENQLESGKDNIDISNTHHSLKIKLSEEDENMEASKEFYPINNSIEA